MASTVLAVVVYAILIIACIFLLWWLSKKPENRGLEIGAVLIKYGMNSTLTWLIVFQLLANAAEAGMLGLNIDKHGASLPRMIAHTAIFVFGILGSLTWVRFFRSIAVAIVHPTYDPWKKWSLGIINLLASAGGLLMAVGAPIANLWLMANMVGNSTQLLLWWHSMFSSHARYLYELLAAGAPQSYAPWGALDPYMATFVTLCFIHIFVSVFEVVIALRLSLINPNMEAAFDADILQGDEILDEQEKRKKEEEKKNNKAEKEKEKDKEKEKNKENKQEKDGTKDQIKMIEGILDFCQITDQQKRVSWSDIFVKALSAGTDTEAIERTAALGTLYVEIQSLIKNSKSNKGRTAADVHKELSEFVFKHTKYRLPHLKKN